MTPSTPNSSAGLSLSPSLPGEFQHNLFDVMLINDLEWLGEQIITMRSKYDLCLERGEIPGEDDADNDNAPSCDVFRIDHWKAFERFFELYKSAADFGRIHNTHKLCQLSILITSAGLKEKDLPWRSTCVDSIPLNLRKLASKSFESWDGNDWDLFIQVLDDMQCDLHRRDAAEDVLPSLSDSELDNIRNDTLRGKDPPNQSSLIRIKKALKLLKAAQPIRQALRSQKGDQDLINPAQVDRNLIDDLWRDAQNESSPFSKTALFSMFESATIPKSAGDDYCNKAPPKAKLKTFSEIEKQFDGTPAFSFDILRIKVHTLLSDWYQVTFKRPPVLRASYAEEPEIIESTEKISIVQRSIASADDGGGDHPVDDSLSTPVEAKNSASGKKINDEEDDNPSFMSDVDSDIASGGLGDRKTAPPPATTADADVRKKNEERTRAREDKFEEEGTQETPYSKPTHAKPRRKSSRVRSEPRRGMQLVFSDSESEDLDGPINRKRKYPAALVPQEDDDVSFGRRRRGLSKSQQKTYRGKRAWTEEEKFAVREGAQSIGVGKWAAIKKEYWSVLEDRTSGQIKDCYRQMKNKGEL